MNIDERVAEYGERAFNYLFMNIDERVAEYGAHASVCNDGKSRIIAGKTGRTMCAMFSKHWNR